MSDLLTPAQIGAIYNKHEKTIRRWKCQGKITAEIDTGHTILFDPKKVRSQLVKLSRKPAKPTANQGEMMVPTY